MSDASPSPYPSTSPTSPPPPKKRRRWLRRLTWFVVFLLALVTAAPLALGLKPVREAVASEVSKALGRKTTIGGASGSWWGGFELRDVEVHNPDGWQGDPLVSIDRVHLDVRLMKLVTGTVDATLEVDRPAVTLLRTKDGRSNTDGLAQASGDSSSSSSSGQLPTLIVRVRDGSVVAQELSGTVASEPDRIDAITLDAEVGADGHKLAAFSAIARRAGKGGVDAKITLDARLAAEGSGPVALSIPPVDLARFARMASTAGIEGLSGSFEAKADLTMDAKGRTNGSVSALLAGLSARRGTSTFSIGSATFDVRPAVAADATSFSLQGVLKDVAMTGAPGTTPFREPAVTIGAEGAWDADGKKLTLAKASVAAGAVSAAVKPGFVIESGARSRASGELVVDADFARLGTLRAMDPTLDSLISGTLHAEAQLASVEGVSGRWSLRADRLTFSPGALSTRGHVEPSLVARGSFARTDAGVTTFELAELSSSIVNLAKAAKGLGIRLSDAGPAVDSPGTISIDLAALSRAMDRMFGLAPGESLGGRIDLTPSGSSRGTVASFAVELAGLGVRFPGAPAGALTGKLVGTSDTGSKTTTLESVTLSAFGIDVRAKAVFGADAAGATAMRSAEAHVTGDLATARPMLGALLGLAPDAQLAGRLRSDLDVAPSGGARSVRGKTTIEALHFVSGRDPAKPTAAPTTFDEPQVVVEHDLTLDAFGPDSMRLDRVTLASGALSAAMTGSTRGAGEARVLDAKLTIDGDASRLATRLKAFLGAGYEDMAGEGRIPGQVVLVGPTAGKGRDLRIDAELSFTKFVSSGITAENGRLHIERPDPSRRLTLSLGATINRGTVKVTGDCDYGRGESPWSTKVSIRGLDTSPVLVSGGAGHYLALVMPAIVPADATTNVLSGLLDADLDVTSAAIDQPRLADTLSGTGSVRMTQGSVKDSTIFSSLAGDGAGKGLSALIALVPGVGQEFRNLSRALMFQSLSSTFSIASRRIQLNPVELISPSVELRFTGVVGFDGASELSIPLKLGGDAGRAVEPYLADRTIPLRVSTPAGGKARVTPDLSPEKFVTGGLLDKGKDVLDGLFGGKKKR